MGTDAWNVTFCKDFVHKINPEPDAARACPVRQSTGIWLWALSGNCISNQSWACFVHFLKILNLGHSLENNLSIQLGKLKMTLIFQ